MHIHVKKYTSQKAASYVIGDSAIVENWILPIQISTFKKFN